MFQSSASRVASAYVTSKIRRYGRTVPMYTDEAMAVLGLPPTATMDEAKKAFRVMMLKHHPDHGGSHEKALEILEAWNQLKEGQTINRPYGSRPRPTPYSAPPRPSSPPPRPTPTPPRPTPPPPTGNPNVKMTWQKAEQLTGKRSNPDAKDRNRIADMINRSKGNTAKLLALAMQMANSIDGIDKALRRGRAAEEHADFSMGDRTWVNSVVNAQASRIFYNRAFALAGVAV